MDQRKYERIKARLMQKKREAGDALKAIAHKPGNPAVSREYGKATAIKKRRRRCKGTMKTNPRDFGLDFTGYFCIPLDDHSELRKSNAAERYVRSRRNRAPAGSDYVRADLRSDEQLYPGLRTMHRLRGCRSRRNARMPPVKAG